MNKIAGVTVTSLIFALVLITCGKAPKQGTSKAESEIKAASKEVKDTVIDANSELKKQATEDWQKFKQESESEITKMEGRAKELEQKVTKASKSEKAKLKIRLDKANERLRAAREKLKQRNADFESDLKKFDESVVKRNESFKREFKHDMDELGTALKDLFKNNEK